MIVLLVLCGVLTIYGVFMTLCATGKITMPFTVDRGFRIFAVPDATTRRVMVDLLGELGLSPKYEIDGGGIQRDLLNDGATVINNATPELYRAMGSPAAAIAVVVKHPVAMAEGVVEYLANQGMSAQVLGELDKSLPAGAMVFIHVDNVPWLLVLRVHRTKMGKRPTKYRAA